MRYAGLLMPEKGKQLTAAPVGWNRNIGSDVEPEGLAAVL